MDRPIQKPKRETGKERQQERKRIGNWENERNHKKS
jgi:hypothetical protein